MPSLVLWTGPVNESQVPGATVPGAKLFFIGCRGDKTPDFPYCPGIGDGLSAGGPQALWDMTKAPADTSELFLGAFSAGGSLLKRLLLREDYRKLTSAVMLSDATYTSSWVDAAKHIPPPIEGFVQYALDVVNGPGDKLFVATASPNPNNVWASGIENLRAMRAEIEVRTGRTFQKLERFYDISVQPEAAYRLGNVIFAEYPSKPLGHNHTKIAPEVWQQILVPWLERGKGPIDGQPLPSPGPDLPLPMEKKEEDSGLKYLLAGLGFVAGLGAMYWARRRLW